MFHKNKKDLMRNQREKKHNPYIFSPIRLTRVEGKKNEMNFKKLARTNSHRNMASELPAWR